MNSLDEKVTIKFAKSYRLEDLKKMSKHDNIVGHKFLHPSFEEQYIHAKEMYEKGEVPYFTVGTIQKELFEDGIHEVLVELYAIEDKENLI